MSAWGGQKRLWIIGGLVCLVGGLAMARQVEHRKRIAVEQQLAQAVQANQLLEAKMSALAKRSQELSDVLAIKTKEVEQTVRRLEEEAHTVARLQGRLAQMKAQMAQLQSELVLALRERNQLAQGVQAQGPSTPIELEKIVVTPRPGAIQGRVVQVNKEWQFVVIDLGWELLSIGDVLGVYRGDEFIAKIRVERVQQAVAAASILPDYQTTEIVVDDRVVAL